MAAVPEAQASALAPLPLALAQRIFVSLPVDCRGRASCVCRAWRDTLAEPALWTRLEWSDDDSELDADLALLQGAAARAQGLLTHLDVSRHSYCQYGTPQALLAVVAANAGSLRELRVGGAHTSQVSQAGGPPYGFNSCTLEALLGAAPLLQVLEAAAVSCEWDEAPALMRADEPPWAPLRLRALSVRVVNYGYVGIERVAPFAAALADATLQPTLSRVSLERADTQRPEVLDALVDAALARRLPALCLRHCTRPAPAPLARLLAGGALTCLTWHGDCRQEEMFDAAGAAVVAEALLTSEALTSLELFDTSLWRDGRVTDALLGALVGHPRLRSLRLADGGQEGDAVDPPAVLGAALAALVAADAPALQELDISCNALYDAGLAPLVAALPRNRHLRVLYLYGTGMSERFARQRLLPAVRASTALQELVCVQHVSAEVEAQCLVRYRPQRR
jgi:hypothetical protein